MLVPIDREVLDIKAGALAGVPVIIEACRPQQIHAIVVATLDQEVGVQEAGVDDMGPGQEARCCSAAWILGVAAPSEAGPMVVSTWVIRCGRSSSQVSVRGTL